MAKTTGQPSAKKMGAKSAGVKQIDNCNQIIERQLAEAIGAVEFKLGGDCLTVIGPIVQGVDDLVRQALEERDSKQERLFVILETYGGYIETAQRIADSLRKHYKIVEFVVPNFAMSAGTVLVMCGDAIHMDYYSILGPIDPQVDRNGAMVPALGYLEMYDRLIAKAAAGKLTTAEVTYLVQNFNPAELYQYEQASKLSVSLLEEWLVKYKFKNWKRTQTRGLRVTPAMRKQRATEVAKNLGNTKRWNSHGRGISRDVLIRDVKVQIEDFGDDEDLNNKIRRYYRLLKDYMGRVSHSAVIHWSHRYVGILRS